MTGAPRSSANSSKFGPGFGPLDAGAGVDHRAFGAEDGSGGFADIDRVGAVFVDADRGVVEVADFLIPDVGGDFDDGGAAAAVADRADGAAHDIGDLGGKIGRLGEFGDAAHLAGGAEIRVDLGDAARVALRDHQHRDGFGIGLRDAAIGVLGTGAVLHAEGADLAAGGDAGDGVGHVQADALLAHDHRADVGRGGEFQQVVDRIAAEDLDPLALHNLSDSLTDFHPSIPFWFFEFGKRHSVCPPKDPDGRTSPSVWQRCHRGVGVAWPRHIRRKTPSRGGCGSGNTNRCAACGIDPQ